LAVVTMKVRVNVPAAGNHRDIMRFDITDHPQVADLLPAAIRRWAEDCELSTDTRERLGLLAHAAVSHGLRFDPSAVDLLLRWLDPNRLLIDLRCVGCAEAATPTSDRADVGGTISTLDVLAADWGIRRDTRESVLWMVTAV
jgi:hypothetical protein